MSAISRPGFLAHFSAETVFDGFAEFEDAAGGFPVTVVGALDEQGAVVVVRENGGEPQRT